MHIPKKLIQAITLTAFVSMLIVFVAYRSGKFLHFFPSSDPNVNVSYESFNANTLNVAYNYQDTTRKKKRAAMPIDSAILKKAYLSSSKSGAVVEPASPVILRFPTKDSVTGGSPMDSSRVAISVPTKSDSIRDQQKRDSIARRQAIMSSSKSGGVVQPWRRKAPKKKKKD